MCLLLFWMMNKNQKEQECAMINEMKRDKERKEFNSCCCG
jgi:hypothetical protein